jgi:hypothetical protein
MKLKKDLMSFFSLIRRCNFDFDFKTKGMKKKYLDAKQATEYLGISLNRLYVLNHYRVLNYYKPLDGKVYYDIRDLDAYVTAKKVKARI